MSDNSLEKAISLVKKSGINIIPIDINLSSVSWEISEENNSLIQPLLSIKGLGMSAIDQIVKNRSFNTVEELLFKESVSYSKLNKKHLDALAKSGALDNIWKNDSRFNHLRHFWLACINERPISEKKMKEQIEKYKDEKDFSDEEKIEFITNVTGIYPIDMVISKEMSEGLRKKCVPPLSEYDADLKVCCGVIRNIETKITKKGKPYYVVDIIDENFDLTKVRCWGIIKGKDKLFVNHPYMMKLNYSDEWGFSTNGIVNYNWKMIG